MKEFDLLSIYPSLKKDMYLKILEKSKIELLHRIEEKSFMMGREIMGMVDLNMMEDGRKLQKEFSNTIN